MACLFNFLYKATKESIRYSSAFVSLTRASNLHAGHLRKWPELTVHDNINALQRKALKFSRFIC